MKFAGIGVRSCAALIAGAVLAVAAGPAAALQPPEIVVGAAPPDGTPGPELPMKQEQGCVATGLLPNSDITQAPPPETSLDLARARALSRGAGVTVAVLDTGVTPNPRLPNLIGGGDYVQTTDGLADCDAHGTLVAGIIGAASDPADKFLGVAPEATILSIRYRSNAFRPERPDNSQPENQSALEIRTLARAITHAANLGAGVITVGLPVCIKADARVDQSMLAAAVGYAVHVRGALIVAGAGNTSGTSCNQNPDIDPGRPNDPRNWRDVETISTPGWFAPDVLTVGFTTASGTPMSGSLMGPWVGIAAPGAGIESLGPGGTNLINGVGSDGKLVPVGGASFAAAYVSGVAALLRSRFPTETPAEIMARLQVSAHAPARGVDNLSGAGMLDPLGALSYRTPPKAPEDLYRRATLVLPPPPRPRDLKPLVVAAAIAIGTVLLGVGVDGVLRRRR
ncbi:type VII secretion-associated serine protease mycosin [Nocardia blacklockiae]|uniref:type VII secretion-associated serine protease mycosin n=1 Tax=Nocardia blacklockiae TaxID=480036 RepID=UPI001892F8A8|nr:type VII secretion-associated serine protease mycosin [Nocardia blacklockiae]MBF6175635.1 type VII secretion-associated serine protease mycosin [Nocardia blacklockiae]